MRSISLTSRFTIVAGVALTLWACKDGGTGLKPEIAVSVAPAALSVAQGDPAAAAAVTVERRNGFAQPITLSAEGLPAHVTAAFTPAAVSANSTGSALAFTIGASAPPGVHTVTIRAKGQDVADRTATVALTINAVAPSYTLSLTPPGSSVLQGTNATAQLSLTRSVTFPGPVTLALEGAPAGVTGSFSPNPATANGSTLTLAVGANTAPGTYTLTVRGTGNGLADRTASYALQVSASGSTGNVTFRFCRTPLPMWVGYQSDAGPWVQASAGPNGTYSVPIASRGGVAFADGSPRHRMVVFYGTAAELEVIGQGWDAFSCSTASGPKQLSGTIAGVSASDDATVWLGPRLAITAGGNTTYTLRNVREGADDLLAVRGVDSDRWTANAVIVRRGLDLPNGSVIPLLDFNSAEAIATVPATFTLGGVTGVHDFLFDVTYRTARGAEVSLSSSFGGGATQPYVGLPSAQLGPGDLYEVWVAALPFQVSDLSARTVESAFRTVENRTVTLGPELSGVPTVTAVSNTPYARYRAQIAAHSEYPWMATAFFSQANRDASVWMTAGYLGGQPATWDLVVPDLSGAAGFNPTWGLQPGVATDWSVRLSSGDLFRELQDGETVRYAERLSASPAAPAIMAQGEGFSAKTSHRVPPAIRDLLRSRGGRVPQS